MAATRKARRLPPVLSLGAGGLSPPVTEYAKPKAHVIWYNSGATWTEPQKAAMAKYASVQMEFGLADGASTTNLAASIADVRSRNPAIKFFAYTMTAEARTGASSYDFGGTYGDRGAKLKAANWFVRNAAGQRLRSFSGSPLPAYAGDTFINERGNWAATTVYNYQDIVNDGGTERLCITPHTSQGTLAADASKWSTDFGVMGVNYCPGSLPDHLGVNWATWYANHAWTYCNRGGVVWDGIYLDHGSYSDIDIALDWQNVASNVTQRNDAATKRDVEAFLTTFTGNLKTVFGNPELKLLGNMENGTLADEFITTQGKGVLYDGMLHESTCAPMVSWSNITFAGINNNGVNSMMYAWLPKTAGVRDPANNYSVLGVGVSSATDYQNGRLGLALALFRDGRPTYQNHGGGGYAGSTPAVWFDELDQPLGAAIDPMVGDWVGNIAKRRFQNGVVIVNAAKFTTGTDRGAWASGVAYVQGDKVLQGGLSRTCKYGQGHTSAASFATDDAAGRWHTMTGTAHPALIAGAPVTIDSSIIPYGIYRRFSGTQDPVQNNGATVSGSFSLAGWDAILLLCVTPGVHS